MTFNNETICGKIIHLDFTAQTKYGARAEVTLEVIDTSTGEVTYPCVLAWKEEALKLAELGLGKDAGVTGYWKKDEEPEDRKFRATKVSEVMIRTAHKDPALFARIAEQYGATVA